MKCGLSILSSTKTECDYLNGWIKKKKIGHIRKNLTQTGEPQRCSWGTQKKKKKKKEKKKKKKKEKKKKEEEEEEEEDYFCVFGHVSLVSKVAWFPLQCLPLNGGKGWEESVCA